MKRTCSDAQHGLPAHPSALRVANRRELLGVCRSDGRTVWRARLRPLCVQLSCVLFYCPVWPIALGVDIRRSEPPCASDLDAERHVGSVCGRGAPKIRAGREPPRVGSRISLTAEGALSLSPDRWRESSACGARATGFPCDGIFPAARPTPA